MTLPRTIWPEGAYRSVLDQILGDTARPEAGPTLVMRIVPPRDNLRDALAIANLLSALQVRAPFALELSATSERKQILLRAGPRTMRMLIAHLEGTYPQARFEPVQASEDPAQVNPHEHILTAELALARPEYLPLRTFRDQDFKEADPLTGILGALSKLDAGERTLSQLILSPAPHGWARRWQGSLRAMEAATSTGAPGAPNGWAFAFWMVFTIASAWLVIYFLLGNWSTVLLILALGIPLLGGLWYGKERFTFNADPVLVREKIEPTAYRAWIRLCAIGPTREALYERLQQVVGAYRQLNLEAGNQLDARLIPLTQPANITDDPVASWHIAGRAFRPWGSRIPILNVNELAALWHLPRAEQPVQGMAVTDTTRLAPASAVYSQGIHIGTYEHQGRRMPVHLPLDATTRNMLLVAKTQRGKSTLIARMAQALMNDPQNGLIVFDPASDLARALLQLVPAGRMDDVVYVNLAERDYPVGYNPLDARLGREPNKIVSNLIHTFAIIWDRNWGPRMEMYFRVPTLAMCLANATLVANQLDHEQYTILDIPLIFKDHAATERLISLVNDPYVLWWFKNDFKPLRQNERLFQEVVSPVLTKMEQFRESTQARAIFGQPISTINLARWVQERKLVLINIAEGMIGKDNSQLIGAVMLDTIAETIREQVATAERSARARTRIVVDEFQALPTVDYADFLATLAKYGANFILATQSLGIVKELDPRMFHALLANVSTLCAFQTNYSDAEILSAEMGGVVTPEDIVGLPDHACFLSLVSGGVQQPPVYVQTLPPQPEPASEERAQQIIGQSRDRYGHPIDSVLQQQALAWLAKVRVPARGGHATPEASGLQPQALARSAEGQVPSPSDQAASATPDLQMQSNRPPDDIVT